MQHDGLHNPHGEITPCCDINFSVFIKETLSKNQIELSWFGFFLIQFNKKNILNNIVISAGFTASLLFRLLINQSNIEIVHPKVVTWVDMHFLKYRLYSE